MKTDELQPGDRVQAVVALTWPTSRFAVAKGATGDVSFVDGTSIGVEWDDNPFHMIIITSRCMLEKVPV